MAQVGCACLIHRVVVDVDDVVEHAHGVVDGFLQLLVVQLTFLDVIHQIDRAEVADRDLFLGGVERDLGAQVR